MKCPSVEQQTSWVSALKHSFSFARDAHDLDIPKFLACPWTPMMKEKPKCEVCNSRLYVFSLLRPLCVERSSFLFPLVSFLAKRKFCRECGKVVCQSCSENWREIRVGTLPRSLRVCKLCAINPTQGSNNLAVQIKLMDPNTSGRDTFFYAKVLFIMCLLYDFFMVAQWYQCLNA